MSRPTPGQPAPALELDLIIGMRWVLADQSPEAFTMVVAYRGLHCPICAKYLKGLRAHYDAWLAAGVEVIHVSMDEHAAASKAHDDWGLEPVPMGYGLTEAQARDWGLYLSDGREGEPEVFSEPGLFLVRPDGTLFLAETSSAPFARPDLEMLRSKIGFVVEKGYPPRGTRA
jgi:peroxiredoxin